MAQATERCGFCGLGMHTVTIEAQKLWELARAIGRVMGYQRDEHDPAALALAEALYVAHDRVLDSIVQRGKEGRNGD